MKNMKKILALVIAVMVLAASMSIAFAADADIKFPTDTKWSNHIYEIYQIYTGDVNTESEQGLLNIKYGANHLSGTPGNAVGQEEIEELTTIVANARGTADLTNLLAMNGYVDLTKTPFKTLDKTTPNGKVTVPTGYYLIKDRDNTQESGDTTATDAKAYTLYILEVLQDEYTISPKASVPEDTKEVGDINDSTETSVTYGTDGDWDIGDMVPYKLTATMADNVTSYRKYHITFQDAQSIGLSAPTSFNVNVLGQDIALSSNTVGTKGTATTTNTKITAEIVTPEITAPTGGNAFAIKVSFEPTSTDANAALLEGNSQVITVTYASELNSNAKIGTEGNPNTSYIKFSNNPNSADDSDEAETPEKTAIVFTYKFELDKVDQDYHGLNGAGFVMLKKVVDQTATAATTVAEATNYAQLKDVNNGDIVSYVGVKYEVVKNWGVQASGYEFAYPGIDDGIYKIVETVVPTGYNHAADVDFTVTGTHSNKTLTNLETNNSSVKANKNGGTFEFGEIEGKKNTINAGSEAAVATSIINQSGVELPSTGGMGTTLLYVGGSILVVLAAILLITKRRMSGND